MQIILYKCTAPPDVVNKNLFFQGSSKTVDGEWFEDSSILNPHFKLKRDITLLGYNYCKVPDFNNRFYYIDDIISNNPFIELQCRVDVLETYKASILDTPQYVVRQAEKFDNSYKDDRLPLKENPMIDFKKIGMPFHVATNSRVYSLVCVASH